MLVLADQSLIHRVMMSRDSSCKCHDFLRQPTETYIWRWPLNPYFGDGGLSP